MLPIILAAPSFDPTGYVEIDPLASSRLGETRRRVNRIATLDGGAVFNDFGHSEADRTIEVKWIPGSLEFEANVVRMVQTYSDLFVATSDGVFRASPETYRPAPGENALTLLVAEKLSA